MNPGIECQDKDLGSAYLRMFGDEEARPKESLVQQAVKECVKEKFPVCIMSKNSRGFKVKKFVYDPATKRTKELPGRLIFRFKDLSLSSFKSSDFLASHFRNFGEFPVIINFTSSAQHAWESEFIESIRGLERARFDKENLYKKSGIGWVKINTLSQEEEAKLVQLALEEYATHKDQSNKKLSSVTARSIMADDLNEDSGQNLYLLPKQTTKFGAKWARNQAKKGHSLAQISLLAKSKIDRDLLPTVTQQRHVLGAVGLSAKALRNKEVVAALKIKRNDVQNWRAGQITKPFVYVIEALQTAIKRYDTELNALFNVVLKDPKVQTLLKSSSLEEKVSSDEGDADVINDSQKLIVYLADRDTLTPLKRAAETPEAVEELFLGYKNFESKLTPLALILGRYQAYMEKYRENWEVLSISTSLKRYNRKTNHVVEKMKPGLALGAAKQFFTEADKTLTHYGKTLQAEEMKST